MWLGRPRRLRQRKGCHCAVRRLARRASGRKHGIDRLSGFRTDLTIQFEAVPRLEVGDRGLGVGTVIAGPAQTVAEAGQRALNRLDRAAPIAETQNPIGDNRGDALLRDVLLRGQGMHRNGLRREIARPRRELDALDQWPQPGVPGDPVLHAVGPARRARITKIDCA